MDMGASLDWLRDPEGEAVLAVPRQVWSLIPERLIRSRGLFAVALEGSGPGARLVVAMADPGDLAAVDEVAFATNLRVRPVAAHPAVLRRLISLHLGGAPVTVASAVVEAIDLPVESGPALKREDWITPLAPGKTKWR